MPAAPVPVGAGLLVLAAAATHGPVRTSSLEEPIPDDPLGQAAGIDALGSSAVLPAGYALAGLAADRFGPAPDFVPGGAVSAAVIAIGLLHPVERNPDERPPVRTIALPAGRMGRVPRLTVYTSSGKTWPMRELVWVGSSLKNLRAFPEEVRRGMGRALRFAQGGDKRPNAKPLAGFGGAGVLEVVEDDDGNTYRAVYVVTLPDAVYVLHALQKKSKRGRKTPQSDIDLVRERLKRAEQRWRESLEEEETVR